ncbi:hypothetical protein [Amycolatopsis sp. NPDC004169]|uniref:hypothetical protein n=1 Tax=Amycolatopsis sp. NPDC004169 TaxID=3154453 RepID=UPI0033ADA214
MHETEYGLPSPLISRRRLLTTTAGTAAGLALGGLATTPALAASGDSHLVIGTNGGVMGHKLRFRSGGWNPVGWGDVNAATGNTVPWGQRATAAAVVNGELNTVVTNGNVYHALRLPNGQWTTFNELEPFTGSYGYAGYVGAAAVSGELHVAISSTEGVRHTVRHGNGLWEPFREPIPVNRLPGTTAVVTLAGSSNGELHMVALDAEGSLYHRARRTNGTWTPFASLGIKQVNAIGMAESGSLLHVAVDVDGVVYHRVRFRDGSWTPFALLGPAPEGASWYLAGAGYASGEFHLASVRGSGTVYHRARYTDGNWSGWAFVGTVPNGLSSAGLALAGER